ncbi:MAG: helix-turn-helix domain-containing protein [Ferrovibrio sp.]
MADRDKITETLHRFPTGRLGYAINEVKTVLPLGETKIYEELKQRRLRAKKIGDRTIIPIWDLVEWLENQPDYQSPLPARDGE